MPNPRGEEHHNAKLTAEQVAEVRRADQTASDYELATQFGCDRSLVRQVRLNAVWHDPDYEPRQVKRGPRPKALRPSEDKRHPAATDREDKA